MKDNRLSEDRKAGLVRLATYAAVTAAGLLIAAKLVTWLMTGSVSILSTLVDSLVDIMASLINLFAVRHAFQPADYEHRFGHGKAEPLAGLVQSAFVAGSAVFLLFEVGNHLVHPREIEHSEVGVVVMVIAIFVTLALVMFQRYVVRGTGSVAIAADSLHYQSDILVNCGVIVALLMSSRLGWHIADPVIGGVIALYILFYAYVIARRSLNMLMDHELPDEDRRHIREIACSHPDVIDMHDVRTRASGMRYFIQLHLEMDGDLSLIRAHEIADEVELQIRKAFPNAEIIIHEDPEGIAEERVGFSE